MRIAAEGMTPDNPRSAVSKRNSLDSAVRDEFATARAYLDRVSKYGIMNDSVFVNQRVCGPAVWRRGKSKIRRGVIEHDQGTSDQSADCSFAFLVARPD
jgi:hypothetical protein